MQPIVGIPTCLQQTDGMKRYSAVDRYCKALIDIAGVVPILIPSIGPDALVVLNRLDGILLPGSDSNIWPGLYGEEHSLTPDKHDPDRDSTTIPLIRTAIEQKIPILAICRGMQELNVALGGSLHQQLHTIKGKFDHRSCDGTLSEKFAPRHEITTCNRFRICVGMDSAQVNSLHEQGINKLATGLEIGALASDNTIEAVFGDNRDSFILGVQFHPEWNVNEHLAMKIFTSFQQACKIRSGI